MKKARFYGIPPNFELHEWAEAHKCHSNNRDTFWDPGCPICRSAVDRLILMLGGAIPMSISDEEAYQRGLVKLGLIPLPTFCKGALDHFSVVNTFPDLRRDPGFAWRVLEALDMVANDRDDVLNALEAFTQKAMAKRHGSSLRDELHTAVCELGRKG